MNNLCKFFQFFYASPSYYTDEMRKVNFSKEKVEEYARIMPEQAENIRKVLSLEREKRMIPINTLMGAIAGSMFQGGVGAFVY
jgi:hypothetical protein